MNWIESRLPWRNVDASLKRVIATDGLDRASDIVGLAFLGSAEAADEVIGRIHRMSIEARNPSSLRGADADVHRARDDTRRIVEHSEPAMPAPVLKYVTGAVGGHSVHDQDLQSAGHRLGREDRPQARLDKAGLIARGNDDAEQRASGRIHDIWLEQISRADFRGATHTKVAKCRQQTAVPR